MVKNICAYGFVMLLLLQTTIFCMEPPSQELSWQNKLLLSAAATGDKEGVYEALRNAPDRSELQAHEALLYAISNGHSELVDIFLRMLENILEEDERAQFFKPMIGIATQAGHCTVAAKIAQFLEKKKNKITETVSTDFVTKMLDAIEHKSAKTEVDKLLTEYFNTYAFCQLNRRPLIDRRGYFSVLGSVIIYAIDCNHPEIIDELLDLLIDRTVLVIGIMDIFNSLSEQPHEYSIVLCEHLISRQNLCSCDLFLINAMIEGASDAWGQLTEQEAQRFEAVQMQLESRAQQCQSRQETIAQILLQRHGESRMPTPLDLSQFAPK